MSAIDHRAKLDAKLVNAFIAATTTVLGTMANTQAQLKELKPSKDYASSGDISAVIGIMGEAGEGMVALSLPLSLANLLVGRLIDTPADKISTDDRCDGIGELANMISGHAKAELSKESGSIYKLSLPSVILGAGHEVSSRPKNLPYLVLVFEADQQLFHLQLCFRFN